MVASGGITREDATAPHRPTSFHPPLPSPHTQTTSFATGPLEASPLPAGTDPAMQQGQGGGRSSSSPIPPPATEPVAGEAGFGNGDAPNHPMDHQSQSQSQEEKGAAAAAAAAAAGGVGADAAASGSVVPEATDLMRDACFAPSDNLPDYNEYGFRKLPAGSQLGAWFVAAGDVDEYYAPAVAASPAAHASAPSTPASAAPQDDGDDDGDDADAAEGPGGDDSELSWLLPRGAAIGCQAVLDINGERPATIMQTFATVRGGWW
jgi:hypothetical protein